jgi:creatinine amidohydrolase/Fe(II)-dependent formamide hydrolase-like protein
VLGDPTGATAAEGHQLLDALAATLVEQVAAWRVAPRR